MVVFFAALMVALPFVASPNVRLAEAQQATLIPYGAASETYYRVDTDNGRLSVRVDVEFQNISGQDLKTLPVYFLPGAENVVVTQNGAALETKIDPGNEAAGAAGKADATLPTPLKPNLRTKFVATYDIAPRNGSLMQLEAGIIETPFIGQGPGSFVLVDVPEAGENVFDPGCLKATDQPKDVTADGFVRWVCGDVNVIAINLDDQDVLDRCASMDDKCRQRTEIAVFSAYVLSITDQSKSAKLEAEIQMMNGPVTMVLKYFKRDQAWADKQFALAQKAFPRLEQLFGYPYYSDEIVMRQSHHIGNFGAAGIAFPGIGEVLLATDTGIDEEVTVHELAHQWAGFNLETKWMWEGMAEWATRVLAAEFGYPVRVFAWRSFPVQDQLSLWYNGSSIFVSDYWYAKSGDFWFAYEAAVGGRENMTAILQRMKAEESLWPVSARWFMDQGEWVGGKNLDALFLEWVFNPVTATSLLEERREVHNQVREMQARALTMGLTGMPSDIYDNLIAWIFDPVPAQVAKANKALDSYAEVQQLSTEAGLGAPEGVNKYWGHTTIAKTSVVIEEQRGAIAAITSATVQLASKPDDSPSKKKLAEAREKYSAGEYTEAKNLAAEGVTSAYNEVAAGKMIEIAKQKQADFSPNFFARIGLIFEDPAGDLEKAEAAWEAGDGAAALKLSRGAYDTWNGASEAGIQRLAMVAALMCAISFGVWFILRRLEGPVVVKKAGEGHVLDSDDRRGSWRDWENQK